jgi:hypothetical protein
MSRLVLSPKKYGVLCDKVFERDHWKCIVCKRRGNLHAHHIVFRSHGGDDADWNLLTVCNDCHEAIHMRLLVILPFEGERVDANKDYKIVLVSGWRPKVWRKKW